MRKGILLLLLLYLVAVPASAIEIRAPEVPDSGREWMPGTVDSFPDALKELARNVFDRLLPEWKEAKRIIGKLLAMVLITGLVQSLFPSAGMAAELAGCTAIAGSLLHSADAMISLGTDTVREISEYGKLLLPVMTGAMAAQGGVTASAALYTGTAVFNAVLTSLISSVLIPGIRLYLILCIISAGIREDMLKQISEFLKSAAVWLLKMLMTVFTTYLSVTGVVSGTTDAAALKAAKVTISSAVPVVGGILSDASEAVLVSVGLLKNAAGIYGILAVLAVFAHPFLKIGLHYLALKLTAALCGIFGSKGCTRVLEGFSGAMGLLLAITGCCCLAVLISTVCFLKGVR